MLSNPVKVARINFVSDAQKADSPASSTSVRKFVDPFQLDSDPEAVITPAEDFTISINTISKELYSRYSDRYLAGRYNNNYFIVLSRIGIGDQAQPITKLNFLEHIDNMDQDFSDIWAENIVVVDDYAQDGNPQRIYISFHAFCQDLGDSSLSDMKKAANQIKNSVGSVFPALMPFTDIGKAVITGVKNIFFKLEKHVGESKKVEFNLYPRIDRTENIPGEAPLQEGSYIIFFEDTNIESLYLDSAGIVRSSTSEPIPPYIVVNIKKGKRLAPGSLDIKAATEVLSKYEENYGYVLPESSDTKGNASGFLGALQELGRSHRIIQALERHRQLKGKEPRTLAEENKLTELSQLLKEYFGDQNWE